MNAQAYSFLTFECPCQADQTQLAERDLVDDELVWVCPACARPVDDAAKAIQWVDAERLMQMGFVIEGLIEPPKHGDGGCRGGQCGVRQPTP